MIIMIIVIIVIIMITITIMDGRADAGGLSRGASRAHCKETKGKILLLKGSPSFSMEIDYSQGKCLVLGWLKIP